MECRGAKKAAAVKVEKKQAKGSKKKTDSKKSPPAAKGMLKTQIAELEKSRAALKQSEERHRVISELTTDYMCIIGIGPKGEPKMIWASDSMRKMTGRGIADAATIEQWRDSIHPDDRSSFMAFVQRTFATGETGEMEFHSVSKDGRDRWIRTLVKPQRDDKGRVSAIYVGVKDISDRKRAEELLRQSANAWAATFDAMADAIILLDMNSEIVQCNAAFKALVGRKQEEIIGRKCHEVIQGGVRGAMDECPFVKMTASGKRESMEIPLKGKTFEVMTDPILDEKGVQTGSVHILADITSRKKLEKEKALVEEELRQAMKMEAIGRLAGGVAHDFNNMLSGIMGNAEFLQMKLAGDPETAEYADKIISATQHAASLTSQLLAFARKGIYRQVPLDLHKLVSDTAEILANTIDRRIRIELDLKANPSIIRGDPSQLESALMNLSLNARDAMPDGGRLRYSTEAVELDHEQLHTNQLKLPTGRYIRVQVSDTGIGMPPEVQRRLFEPFFTTKAPGKGTGLGLAGVYGTVMSHGGSIQFTSEAGRGSTFTLYLPLALGAELVPLEMKKVKNQVEGGTVLLIDDEPAILDIAQQILQTRGYTVHVYRSSREALEFFHGRHGEIDLVILDMIMPEMDGRSVFDQMKQIDPCVRVLLSSGYSMNGDAADMMREGACGFMQKPFRMAELTGKVSEVLQRR
jgi:two-component system cell cycle sensor histidine kinase/response regulator CckA